MHKLVLLFSRPEDVVEFDRRWSEQFVTVVERMPGLRRVAVGRVTGVAAGEAAPHLVHEFYFDSAKALMEAMESPQGQAAGRALMALAPGQVTICFAEHHEMSLPA
ncbi:MAG: EthD family reductase [Anaerolineales bacterium]|nr:EthD family reductase [Anaerolineales bacterium]